MTKKILTLLGFAAKSGSLSYGMDSTVSSIKANKSRAVVMATDISTKSKKEIHFHAGNKNVSVINFNNIDIETLSKAVGRKCGIISINDSSFADAVCKALTTGGNANEQ